ncbi:hypothetical protein [Bacteroides helcogenes]|uniref:Transmembrane protein n=1 Tax=Bacteroides helcogenes (strain ATCC 35417 / DSM 20613 / JCM 6297 / CCUG 15421 / P 36-108) TaxID=693979 RepID=E6SWG6_BACT6|nr:hypothetical protein [Bacteroides helcogenes]ADV44627.1 hypothetical protein Bache_2677 [Bacteroides helcogenes P 36-108]MDY5238917.1 hypothetical protein [Bacteroides helcogenes]
MKDSSETENRIEQNSSIRNKKKYRYCFLDYLYYRLYVAYLKHNDPARFSAFCVFAAIFMMALFFFSIFFNCVLTDSWFSLKNFTEPQGVLIFFTLTTVFCVIPFYLRYTRKRTAAILLKYKGNPWNRIIPAWVIVTFPIWGLLTGIGICMLIFNK